MKIDSNFLTANNIPIGHKIKILKEIDKLKANFLGLQSYS
jgi:hypothetical protein